MHYRIAQSYRRIDVTLQSDVVAPFYDDIDADHRSSSLAQSISILSQRTKFGDDTQLHRFKPNKCIN